MVILNVIRSRFFCTKRAESLSLDSLSNVKALEDKLTLNYVTPKKSNKFILRIANFLENITIKCLAVCVDFSLNVHN